MEKKLIFIFALLFLIPLISSTATIEQPYNLTVSCDNLVCSSVNVTVLNPNSSVLVNNQQMTNGNSYAYYSLTPQTFGEYVYYVFDDNGNFTSGSFKATSTGYELNTGASIIYVGLLFLFVFIFIANFFVIGILPDSNAKDNDGKLLSISYLKYLRGGLYFLEYIFLVVILFLASNLGFAYLGETLFAQSFFVLFRIALGLAPVIIIIWFVYIIQQIATDRKFWKDMQRGFGDSL